MTFTLEQFVKEGQRLIAKDPKNKDLLVFVSEEGSTATSASVMHVIKTEKHSLEMFRDDRKDESFEVHVLIY